jgi:acyl carrier protein
MTTQEISSQVLQVLGNIAPEAALGSTRPAVPFRDQFDLDSMDMLNFVIALHQEFQIEIPETDYPKLATLDSATAYLQAHESVPR